MAPNKPVICKKYPQSRLLRGVQLVSGRAYVGAWSSPGLSGASLLLSGLRRVRVAYRSTDVIIRLWECVGAVSTLQVPKCYGYIHEAARLERCEIVAIMVSS